MKDDANWCEKTKRTVRARTYRIHAFRSVACIQHGIRKMLQVTKLGAGGGGGWTQVPGICSSWGAGDCMDGWLGGTMPTAHMLGYGQMSTHPLNRKHQEGREVDEGNVHQREAQTVSGHRQHRFA